MILRILFLSGILSAASLAASEPVRLTHDGTLKRDPRFLERGMELVYCYDEAPDLIRMMRIQLDESTAKPMFDNSGDKHQLCLLYTSPSPRDKRQSRMPSSA